MCPGFKEAGDVTDLAPLLFPLADPRSHSLKFSWWSVCRCDVAHVASIVLYLIGF